MKENKIIPIFFASDKNYVPYLTVAIKSLVNKASKNNIYKIYILTNDLLDCDIPDIKALESDNIIIDIIDVNNKIASIKDRVALRDYYTVSIYFRLFIPTLFPEYDKALYLDSDIVINRDIADLYNEDIGNNYLGAVLDEVVWSNNDFTYYVNEALGVSEKQYFNSGVLIMNLKKFRKNKIEDNFYNWVNDFYFGTVAPDQDYLNCICKNSVKYLNPGWNKMPMGEEFSDDKLFLIHYNMFMKPWKYENTMFNNYFWDIAKTTQYYDLMKAQQLAYTDEQKQQDILGSENLLKMAVNIANSDNNYKTKVLNQAKDTNNVKVQQIQSSMVEDEDIELAPAININHKK